VKAFGQDEHGVDVWGSLSNLLVSRSLHSTATRRCASPIFVKSFLMDQKTYLCSPVTRHYNAQSKDVQDGEKDLSEQDVRATLGKFIQPSIDVHMHSRIHQWPSITIYLGVIPLSSKIDLNLLHVCFPINLRV